VIRKSVLTSLILAIVSVILPAIVIAQTPLEPPLPPGSTYYKGMVVSQYGLGVIGCSNLQVPYADGSGCINISNIGSGFTLQTVGHQGAATYGGGVLNIPLYDYVNVNPISTGLMYLTGVSGYIAGNYQLEQTNNLLYAPNYGGLTFAEWVNPNTAPSGSCTHVGWTATVDGDLSFCNGTTWTQPFAGSNPSIGAYPCDLAATAGTPCDAAYSMTRRMFAAYTGNLFQLTRASDSNTQNITSLSSGIVDVATINSFCVSTTCTVTEVYDQTANANHVIVWTRGGDLTAQPTPLGFTTFANGLYVPVLRIPLPANTSTTSAGYSTQSGASGLPTGNSSISVYTIAENTSEGGVVSGCCGFFGDTEQPVKDSGAGHMFSNVWATAISGSLPSSNQTGPGPWLGIDLEDGVFYTGGTPTQKYVININKYNTSGTALTMKYGDATAGALTTFYSGALPTGYTMDLEGNVAMGMGGDGTPAPIPFIESFISSATSDALDAQIQANNLYFYGSITGSGPTLQTSGTNNTSQSNLNFAPSSVDAAGLHVTPSNPTAGNEELEITTAVCQLSGGGTGLGCYAGKQAALPSGGTSGYDWFASGSSGWAQCVGTAACHNLLTDYPVDTTVAVPAATFNANTCTVGANSPLTMTGLTTTMTVTFTANSDTHATTGWGAPGAGVLYITDYPSAANTVTFYVCNNTGSNITTSASQTFNVSAR